METKLDRFLQWFQSHGGYVSPHVELHVSKEHGVHVRAKDTITTLYDAASSPSNFSVCTCPLTLTLSYLTAASPHLFAGRVPDAPVAGKLVPSSDRITVGAFFLMEQKLAGAESFWAAYLDVLPAPEALTSPMYFDEAEASWLRGTNLDLHALMSATRVRQRLWREDFERATAVLGREGVDVSPYTWDLYMWAMSIFASRSITSKGAIPGEPDPIPLLFPMVDLLNHSPGARVHWLFDTEGAMTLAAETLPRPGDQVFNNFGPFPNEKLLLGYGFTLDPNPYDEVAVQLGGLRPAVHAQLRHTLPGRFNAPTVTPESVRFALLGSGHAMRGYRDVALPCLRGVPPDLFTVLEAEVAHSRAEARGAGDEAVDAAREGAEVRMAALVALFEMVEGKLGAIRRWDGGLVGEGKEGKGGYARVYREGQVAILEEIMGELETYLDAAWEGADA